MSFRRWVVGLSCAALVALLAGVGAFLYTLQRDEGVGGIRGTVMAGCQPPKVCLDIPLPATQIVFRRTDDGVLRPVKRFRASRNGSFRVELAPGSYVIASAPDQRWGSMRRVAVRVRGSEIAEVRLLYPQ